MSQEQAIPKSSMFNNVHDEAAPSSMAEKLGEEMLNKLAEFINDANEQEAADRVTKLRATMPDASDQQVIDKLIYNKCVQAATSGAVTAGTALIPGIGPALALTFGVATDIGVTFKLQAELVLEIAAVYGQNISDEEKRTILLGVTGVNMGTDFVARRLGKTVATQATRLLAGHTAVKAIPYLGVAASAGMNIALTYAVGQRAIGYFASPADERHLDSWADTLRAMTGVDREKLAEWLSDAVLQAYALLYPDDDPQPATSTEATSMVVANVSDAAEEFRLQAEERWLETKSRLLDSVNESDYFSAEAKTMLSNVLRWKAPKVSDIVPAKVKESLPDAEDSVEELHIVAVLTPHDSSTDDISEQIAWAQEHIDDAANQDNILLFDDILEEIPIADEGENS